MASLLLGRETLRALLESLVAATIVIALCVGASNRDIRILGRWHVERKIQPGLYWLLLTAGLFVALAAMAGGWRLELPDADFRTSPLAQHDAP
jgi:hypothetical protein